MSPPLAVTEDTPPDMLAGAMDLLVVLPNGHNVKMSVERSTPMMDLLVQITTANKMSTGGHAIRAYGDRGILPHQPSTPIGTLDTWSVHIVPKKSSANAKKHPPFQHVNHNTPFEQTFRLQVNLPRNQLYVSRVSYKMRLEQVFRQVCEEKNLDPSKYCLVHPEKLDEELDLNGTFLECKLQKVTLLLRSHRPPVGLSSVDIMALKRLDNADQRCGGNKYYASHSYDGSVSSGSLEGRSLSPVRSDESSTSPTTSQTNPSSKKPFRKRRPAPKPPSAQNGRDANGSGCDSLTVLHSRNSSDSSGYHESSVLSESPGSNSHSLAESLPRKSKLSDNVADSNNVCQRLSSIDAKCCSKIIGNNLSRSLSNLATDVDDRRKCSTNFHCNGMKPKQYSASSTSLSTIPGKRKKAPAPPPPPSSAKSLLSLKEEEMPTACDRHPTASSATEVTTKIDLGRCSSSAVDAPNAPSPPSPPPSSQMCSSPSFVDSRSRSNETHTATVHVTASQTFCTDHLPVGAKDEELIMDDEEIDRIFRDATKGYESAHSSAISSPPDSVENNVDGGRDEDLASWQYTLPCPPRAFRDQIDSPQVTEFQAVTPANLRVTFNEDTRLMEEVVPAATTQSANNERGSADKTTNEVGPPMAASNWESKYQSSTHDSGLGSDDSIPSVHENKAGAGATFKEMKPTLIERRASTLQNFTISTYQSSKPTEIFHDDSVKTWKTTELAKSNRPFIANGVSTIDKSSTAGNLARHCSFNAADRTPNSQVKRSKSHISLLSGNFAKFNRFGKLDVQKLEHSVDEPDASVADVDLWKQNKLRSQSLPSTNSSFIRMGSDYSQSQVAIGDVDKEEEELLEPQHRIHTSCQREEQSGSYHEESASQLQSLQILKNILPHIDKTQFQGEREALSLGSCASEHGAREQRAFESSRMTTKSFGEPMPSVNVQSWNERPRRQVSIKTDRDYVFGGQGALYGAKKPPSSVDDLSRVPVVRAVEFKKPFTPPPPRVTLAVNDDDNDNDHDHDNHPNRKSSTIVVVGGESKPASVMSSWQRNSSSSSTNLWSSVNGTAVNETTRCGRITGFTFKEYKNKMASKEKYSSKNGIDDCLSCTPSVVSNDYRNLYDCVDNVKIYNNNNNNNNNSDGDSAVKSRKSSNYRSGDVKADPATSRQVSRSSAYSSMPIAPPPPPCLRMPALKPVNRDLYAKRPCSAVTLDPRDLLLSSIKNFDRDRLRKLRVK